MRRTRSPLIVFVIVFALASFSHRLHWFSFSPLCKLRFSDHFPMGGKKRRKDDLTDSDSDSNSADELDHPMDSTSPVLGHRSSMTPDLDAGTEPRSPRTTASGADPRPTSDHARTTGPASTANEEPYLEPSGSFLIIKPKDSNFSFRKINVFWPSKQLGAICGATNLQIETPANGSPIVKTDKRAQTKQLLQCTKFCEQEVTVSLHHARNTTQGTIFAPEMK